MHAFEHASRVAGVYGVCAAVRRLTCFGRPGGRGGCLAASLSVLHAGCRPTAYTFSRFLAHRCLEMAPLVDRRSDVVNHTPSHLSKISVWAHGVTTPIPTFTACRYMICVVRPYGSRSQQQGEHRTHGVQISSRNGLVAPRGQCRKQQQRTCPPRLGRHSHPPCSAQGANGQGNRAVTHRGTAGAARP